MKLKLVFLFLLCKSGDGSGANNINAWGCVSYAVLPNRASCGSNLLQLLIRLQQPVLVVR
jgi:hypothetical protein